MHVNASSRNGRFFTLPKVYYSCKIPMYYIIEATFLYCWILYHCYHTVSFIMSSIIDFDTVSFIFLLWSCDQGHVEIWVIEKRTIICSRKISPVPRIALPAQLDTTAIGITS